MSSQETCQISKKQIYAQKKENKKHIYILQTKYIFEQNNRFPEKIIFPKNKFNSSKK